MSQPPNRTTYALEFEGADEVTVYQDDRELFRLTRQ
ncbi:MAG: hypothetical protein JWN22_1441 [Nocardioides sp.]|nr:hypothetical protein [Nocardioides sp.]